MMTTKPINTYSEEIKRLKAEIENSDAILIGAGAGLYAAAGFIHDSENSIKHFSDFEDKYGFHDMYSGILRPCKTQ